MLEILAPLKSQGCGSIFIAITTRFKLETKTYGWPYFTIKRSFDISAFALWWYFFIIVMMLDRFKFKLGLTYLTLKVHLVSHFAGFSTSCHLKSIHPPPEHKCIWGYDCSDWYKYDWKGAHEWSTVSNLWWFCSFAKANLYNKFSSPTDAPNKVSNLQKYSLSFSHDNLNDQKSQKVKGQKIKKTKRLHAVIY